MNKDDMVEEKIKLLEEQVAAFHRMSLRKNFMVWAFSIRSSQTRASHVWT